MSIRTLVLRGCLLLTAAGCAPAERGDGGLEIDRPDRPAPADVSADRAGPPAPAGQAGPTQGVRAEQKTEPSKEQLPETAKGPRRTEDAPVPPPNGGRPGAAKTVEDRIREAIAELQEEQTADAERQLMQEITGLIVEETMTKIGYEFYEYFFLLWEPPQVQGRDYNILIAEKATPMWGSLIEVKVGETSVFSRMLRPRSEDIEEAVKQAIEVVKEYLENYEKQQLQTPDLMGSGI